MKNKTGLAPWFLNILNEVQEAHQLDASKAMQLASKIATISWIEYSKDTECYKISTKINGKNGVYRLAKENLTHAENWFLANRKDRITW